MSFLELNEAAEILGVTPETLKEMRSRNEIHGYRDGANWKFKREEIDRVAEALRTAAAEAEGSELHLRDNLAAASGGSSKLDADLEELVDVHDAAGASPESVLDQSAAADPTASSTVIGKKELASSESDEDIDLESSESSVKSPDQTGSGLSFDDDDFDISLLDEPDAGASSVLEGSAVGSGFGSELKLVDSSADRRDWRQCTHPG